MLTRSFLNRWISSTIPCLDLGAGYCEFINAVEAKNRFAIDANPSTRIHATAGVTVITQDVRDRWNIADSSLHVVFSSNFLEHLETKSNLLHCLREARRVLEIQGQAHPAWAQYSLFLQRLLGLLRSFAAPHRSFPRGSSRSQWLCASADHPSLLAIHVAQRSAVSPISATSLSRFLRYGPFWQAILHRGQHYLKYSRLD